MKHLKFSLIVMLGVAVWLSSCKKENNDNSKEQETINAQKSEGLIVLGKQLEDPYAIKNMKTAYSKLKSANADIPDVDIKPNCVYLRFLPKNEQEWALLKKDTSLVLFDYPLDFEMVNNGTYYHDPSLPDTAIT
jgi:hypothetical protein